MVKTAVSKTQPFNTILTKRVDIEANGTRIARVASFDGSAAVYNAVV
jgi:hypothetical protein